MSLFKPFRGNRAGLDAVELHDGYAYFCVDDGTFHIDCVDAEGNLQRKQINAKDAETLAGMTIDEIYATSQADWSTNDESNPGFIKNRTHYDIETEIGTWELETAGRVNVTYDEGINFDSDPLVVIYNGSRYEFDKPSYTYSSLNHFFYYGTNPVTLQGEYPFYVLHNERDTGDNSSAGVQISFLVKLTAGYSGTITLLKPSGVQQLDEKYIPTVGDAEALKTLAELNIIEPAHQDGVIYTDTDGAVFII